MPTINPNDPFIKEVFQDIGSLVLRGFNYRGIVNEVQNRYGFDHNTSLKIVDKYNEIVKEFVETF